MSFEIFATLPPELLPIIFSFTTWTDQRNIGLVCRQWAAAVEPLLRAGTCLKVSYRAQSREGAAGTPIRLMDKKLLLNSNRSYRYFKVEWEDDGTAADNTKALQEALHLCQQRFSVRVLYLKGPLGGTLADLLLKYCKWLESLTELHFEEFGIPNDQGSAKIELSLPMLKQLTWIECINHQESSRSNHVFINDGYPTPRIYNFDFYKLHATLDVPELERLRIRVKRRRMTTRPNLDLNYANNCYLFQPSLSLKFCSKLQHVDIFELFDLDQSLVNLSKPFLENLKMFTMFKCETPVIKMICEKCSNLEELTVDEPLLLSFCLLPFKISPVVSRSLKKLTLKKFNASFNAEEAEFPELRCLCLRQMTRALEYNSVTLIAPKLTKLIISRNAYDRLTIVHKDQIRSMVVDVKPCPPLVPPPANITELTLYEREYPYGAAGIQDYVDLYFNLKRLTVIASRIHKYRIPLNLKKFSTMEYLCAREVALRLTDFHELTQLKSLILLGCTIITISGDEEIKLSALKHLRMKGVKVRNFVRGKFDAYWDHFPIYGSGWQPPVVDSAGDEFETPQFKLDLDLPEDVF